MSGRTRTHLLRAKPPWREGGDRTRCGRRVADEPPDGRAGWARASLCVQPDSEMAARAREFVRAKYRISQQPAPRPPAGLCAVCWENLGTYGRENWRADPLAVLRIDLAVTDGAGRVMLGKELIALADLVAAHPDEFRQALEDEAVLAVLGGLSK